MSREAHDRSGTRRAGAPLRPGAIERPHPDRFPPGRPGYDEVLAAHRAAIDRGDPGYLDPVTGLFSLTATFLAARGSCCESGCRHCPFLGGGEGDPG